MDEKYDVVVLGTGLKECIISGLLSVEKKKVLHMDRNSYYGGDTTSMTPLSDLFAFFKIEKDLTLFGRDRDWNVDLIPKFIMATGKLVNMLYHTGVLQYLELKQIDGSYVYQDGDIHKVPSTEVETLRSDLMDLFEKRRFKKFLIWVANFDVDKPSTFNSVYSSPLDVKKDSIEHAFSHFDLNRKTQRFVSHAMCLYPDESFRRAVPVCEFVDRICLYSRSVCQYGKSPYIYPLYGLGELPQSYARLSAVHGGTYMLNAPVGEIVVENGKVVGVKVDAGNVVRCDIVVCDPSYAPAGLVRKVGQVVRAICILRHPIKGLKPALSGQIIIPQDDAQRNHDIYISCISHPHKVCPEGFFIALVATTVETSSPHDELEPGLRLLGQIEQKIYSVVDLYEPVGDGLDSGLFISASYDASTHLESTCDDVLDLYQRITGKQFDDDAVKELLIGQKTHQSDRADLSHRAS